MKLNITLASTFVTFEFDTPRDRDTFWSGMEKSRFTAQGAAQRIGTRTINIATAKIKTPYAWPFEALPSKSANGDVPVKAVETTAATPSPSTPPAAVQQASPPPPPAVPIPELKEVPVAAPATTTTTPPADPEPTGIHKNSRKYREWLARQKK